MTNTEVSLAFAMLDTKGDGKMSVKEFELFFRDQVGRS